MRKADSISPSVVIKDYFVGKYGVGGEYSEPYQSEDDLRVYPVGMQSQSGVKHYKQCLDKIAMRCLDNPVGSPADIPASDDNQCGYDFDDGVSHG